MAKGPNTESYRLEERISSKMLSSTSRIGDGKECAVFMDWLFL